MLETLIQPRIEPRRAKPVKCPQSSPIINVPYMTPGQHTLTYCDSRRPDKKAKPAGAWALEVRIGVGDKPAFLNQTHDTRLVTRNPAVIEFDYKDDGRLATYYARWVSRRGETGPWSAPVSMRIAA